MKKNGIVFAVFALLMVSGCSGKDSSLPPVKPTQIISESEAEKAVGGDCDLVLEYDAVVDSGSNTFTASYVSDPVGEYDPVIVEVVYPSENFSGNDVKKLYNESYDGRVNKRRIEGVGAEAFVAFPTLTVYEADHLIKITAGSGDTQNQLDTLLKLGQVAVENLNDYLDGDE